MKLTKLYETRKKEKTMILFDLVDFLDEIHFDEVDIQTLDLVI